MQEEIRLRLKNLKNLILSQNNNLKTELSKNHEISEILYKIKKKVRIKSFQKKIF